MSSSTLSTTTTSNNNMTNTTSNVDTTLLNSTNNSNTTTIITLDSFKLIDVEFYGAISCKILIHFAVYLSFVHFYMNYLPIVYFLKIYKSNTHLKDTKLKQSNWWIIFLVVVFRGNRVETTKCDHLLCCHLHCWAQEEKGPNYPIKSKKKSCWVNFAIVIIKLRCWILGGASYNNS